MRNKYFDMEDEVKGLRKENAARKAKLTSEIQLPEGHNEPCYYCGEPCVLLYNTAVKKA